MKIGIMADSHENMPMIAKAVEYFNQVQVDLVLHAGDIISPITCKEFKHLNSKLIAVFGNNDGERALLTKKFNELKIEIYPAPYELTIVGKRILLYHIPDFLDDLIKTGSYDVIIYGHTHTVDVREGKTLVINPGECGGWLTNNCTVGILTLPECRVEIVNMENKCEKK
ncbi:MAG: metallophosphoesterase [bacterium]